MKKLILFFALVTIKAFADAGHPVTLTFTPNPVNFGTFTNASSFIPLVISNPSPTYTSTITAVAIINQSTVGAFYWNNAGGTPVQYCVTTLAINGGNCTLNLAMNPSILAGSATATLQVINDGITTNLPLSGTLPTLSQMVNSITFGFTIPPGPDLRTSAAVLDSNGVLVRQLWGNVSYPPGSYTGTWDGKLDVQQFGIAGQGYTIKLLTNNVQYNYDGIIGMTQDNWSSPDRYSWQCPGWTPGGLRKIVLAETHGWISCGYTEAGMQLMAFQKATPNTVVKSNIYYTQIGGSSVSQTPTDMATDNQLVYIAYLGGVAGSPHFVAAFDASGAQPWIFRQQSSASAFGAIVPNFLSSWIDYYPTNTMTLSAVATSSGGTAVYTGTINQNYNNSLVGLPVTITGFVNAVNNGVFVVTASTATTVTLGNPSAIAETHAGTANFATSALTLALSSAAAASGGNTVYTGIIPGGASNVFAGLPVIISGFSALGGYTASPNNGAFTITASTATTITLNNPYAVAQTIAASASINTMTGSIASPTGISVQRTGNMLAISHSGLNRINIFDKKTGACLVGAGCTTPAITGIPQPMQLAFTSEGLWVANQAGQLYLITGLPAAPVVTLASSLPNPIAGLHYAALLASNQLNNRLYVGDGGIGAGSQQVKGFDATTHIQSRTLGADGGYNDCNPSVRRDHLLIDDYPIYGQSYTPTIPANQIWNWLTVDDNDDIWIQDLRGFRIQHFDASNNYVNQILTRRPVYFTVSSQTMPNKLFLPNWMEYDQDFTQPILPGDPDPAAGGNGSWVLSKFWQVCAFGGGPTPLANPPVATPPTAVKAMDIVYFGSVEQLSNGHIYATATNHAGTLFQNIMELPADGVHPIRNTQLQMPNVFYNFAADGSVGVIAISGSAPNNTVTYSKYLPILNPVTFNLSYGSPVTQFSATTNQGNFKLVTTSGLATNNLVMSTGSYLPVLYQANYGDAVTPVYRYPHLGAMLQSTPGIAWTNFPEVCQSPNTTPGGNAAPDYRLHYPCGKSTGNQINGIFTVGRQFFTMFTGNYFGPGGQVYHFYEDGMAMGQFGNTQAFPGGFSAAPPWKGLSYPWASGTNGNTITPSATSINGGADVYFYYGDESFASAHRWHIFNLSSIHEFAGSGVLAVGTNIGNLNPILREDMGKPIILRGKKRGQEQRQP